MLRFSQYLFVSKVKDKLGGDMMKKSFIAILSIVIAILLVSCSNQMGEKETKETTDQSQRLTDVETTAEMTTTDVTVTTEETITAEKETTTEEETTTAEEITTEGTTTESETVDKKAIEAEIQKLWKIESADKDISYSNMNFLFENGRILGGSKNLFKHEYTGCGVYTISEKGKLECTFYSLTFGTSSSCVYQVCFDDTGENMTLYCESCEGTSYFAGKEFDADYKLYFVLTNYPSESKSNDAKLKGDWASVNHEEMEYIFITYSNGFKFESYENGEHKTGTWKGYSGVLILTYSDGTVRTFDYEIDKSIMHLILSSGKEFYVELEKMVPCY